MSVAPRPVTSLVDRLWAKIARADRLSCWLWQAGVSRSGRREVDYGTIRHGAKGSRLWRSHRLVLILHTGPIDVPIDDDETFDDWLRRAARYYENLEASHKCDVSLCCNPEHLEWQSHTENVKEQTKRRQSSRSVPTAAPGMKPATGIAVALPPGIAAAATGSL